MPSVAPVHALGLAGLDTAVAAQRLGQPLARNMEMFRVQVSQKRNAVQIGLPAEHSAKDTAPCLELEIGKSESPSTLPPTAPPFGT